MLIARIVFAAAGIALTLYGIGRLVVTVPAGLLVVVGIWLLGALIIHDGLLSPVVVGVGWALRRFVPDRGRRFLQAGLIMGAIVTVVAIPLIVREGTQPPAKSLLLLDYGTGLTILLGLIAGVTLVAYAVRVARDRSEASIRA